MRSYQADLSRRLNAVFAEQAAMPKTTSTRNLPAEVHPAEVHPAVVQRAEVPLSAAYKPTHGGYPSVGARA